MDNWNQKSQVAWELFQGSFPTEGVWIVRRNGGTCIARICDIPNARTLAEFCLRINDVAEAIMETKAFQQSLLPLIEVAIAVRDDEPEVAKKLAQQLPNTIFFESAWDIASAICAHLGNKEQKKEEGQPL